MSEDVAADRLQWRLSVTCKKCGLTGEPETVSVTQDPANKTLGLLIWVNAMCPRCKQSYQPS
jgi:hypothetical protein